jgi:S-adenosylmethionine hydrolase
MFVAVIGPGVGTARKSIVLKTRSGHYFVSPDNGTLTLVADQLGLDAVREIDETRFRRPGSERSATFYGRDLYSYTAACLASGQASFAGIDPQLPPQMVRIAYQKPEFAGTVVRGNIPIPGCPVRQRLDQHRPRAFERLRRGEHLQGPAASL